MVQYSTLQQGLEFREPPVVRVADHEDHLPLVMLCCDEERHDALNEGVEVVAVVTPCGKDNPLKT